MNFSHGGIKFCLLFTRLSIDRLVDLRAEQPVIQVSREDFKHGTGLQRKIGKVVD
jgi:hypothetical protein